MTDYDIWFLDCDGVVLDSNSLKTEAFRRVGMAYGVKEAEALVHYHVENGGMSRYKKLDYFFKEILRRTRYEEDFQNALAEFGDFVSGRLRECPEIPGVRNFLERLQTTGTRYVYVVSGSDEEELRNVFSVRRLSGYFEGIYGSPATKEEILSRLFPPSRPPAVYCGDSQIDYRIATDLGLDFIMVYGHTEWKEWEIQIGPHKLAVRDFNELAEFNTSTSSQFG